MSVLLVSYNTRDQTLACLRSVFGKTRKVDIEVIVIDNASQDGSADAIAAQFPAATVIRSVENLGFGAANNRAAQCANAELLLLLNPDTRLEQDAISTLVAFSDSRPQAGICGGRTVFQDGSLNIGSCWGAPTPWSTFCRATGLSRLFRWSMLFNPEALGSWSRDSVREVDIVSGCFLLIRRELWDRLHGFHPDFFMYGEDADLCLRARRLGAVPTICPSAEIVHFGGASEPVLSAKLVRLFTAKAQLYKKFWTLHWAKFGVWMLELMTIVRVVAFLVAATFQPRRRTDLREWLAVWHGRHHWRAAFARTRSYGPR